MYFSLCILKENLNKTITKISISRIINGELFFLTRLLSRVKTQDITLETNLKRFWKVETRRRMNYGPQEWGMILWWVHCVFFLPHISQTENWRNQQSGNANGHRQQCSEKSLLSLNTGQWKGNVLIYEITTLFQQNATGEKMSASSIPPLPSKTKWRA